MESAGGDGASHCFAIQKMENVPVFLSLAERPLSQRLCLRIFRLSP